MTALMSKVQSGSKFVHLLTTGRRSFITSIATQAQMPQDIDESEVEAADPFLSKLQQQTEASYLELLSRKDNVPQTEDEELAEQEEEVRSLLHSKSSHIYNWLNCILARQNPNEVQRKQDLL